MKRFRVLVSVLVVLAMVTPARAGGANGRIAFASASPAAARQMWEFNRNANGLIGYVFRVDPEMDDVPYTLTSDGARAELIDVYFYESQPHGRGPGKICPVSPVEESGSTETGFICPGPMLAGWGIAVLVAGANARFAIAW